MYYRVVTMLRDGDTVLRKDFHTLWLDDALSEYNKEQHMKNVVRVIMYYNDLELERFDTEAHKPIQACGYILIQINYNKKINTYITYYF